MKLIGILVFLGCIFYNQAVKIDNTKNDILPSKEICGRQHCEAFPWLVFIPLESRVYNPQAVIRCAGALISKRYVATYKSCLQFVLTKVHIGQFDTTKNVTCENKPVLKLDVEERIINENSDIILLRLAEDVEFGNDISPICLPFENFKRAEPGAEVFSSGWGRNGYEGKATNVMKKVKNILITNEECQKSGILKDASDNTKMCVQQKDNTLEFPCDGDEGSPVMYNNEGQWVLEGILTSLFDSGSEPCSIKKPARGTRITDEDVQWIVEKVHA